MLVLRAKKKEPMDAKFKNVTWTHLSASMIVHLRGVNVVCVWACGVCITLRRALGTNL